MINTTVDQIVFSFSKSKLDSAIRECLRKTVDGLIEFYGLSEVDLKAISTKFCKEGLYSKLVSFYALSNHDHVFDEDYVHSAFLLYQLRAIDDHKQLAYKFLTVNETAVEFREGYVRALTRGIGVFLIALHCQGAITLPVAFNWPRPRKDGKKRVDIGKPFASELIAFIRTLEPQSQELNDPAFAAVVLLKSRREHLSSMGTKLLLATGWHSKEDVNLDELVQVRTAHGSINSEYNAPLPCTAIVDILSRKYGDSINLTPQLYRETLKTRGHAKFRQALGDGKIDAGEDLSAATSMEALMLRNASEGQLEVLRGIHSLPGLPLNFKELSDTWLTIEEAYLKSLKRESYKGISSAIGWLNVYLFLYLPYWFSDNTKTSLKFPDNPSKLLSSVFVTRLVKVDGVLPITFMEMMDSLQKSRRWGGNSYYATLKQVELFFSFVERKAEVLPNSKGFRQPLGPEDFPTTTKLRNTDKRPIERRLFGVTIDLTQALIVYSEVVTQRILERSLDSRAFQIEISRFGRVIDTFQVANVIGFVPILFYRDRTVPLRIIPNCLSFTDVHKLRDFEHGVQIPSPHALNQIFVALHTGLRHNHIQWLDARSFDKWAHDVDSDFVKLHVNTDKRKNEAWEPFVSWCVIERLRAQRKWRDLFDEPGFIQEHLYNDNSDTKWAPIQPLFAFSTSGRPHSDSVYSRVWDLLLSTLQGLLSDLGENPNLPYMSYGRSLPRIGMLEPSGVEYNDPGAVEKRKKAGAKEYSAGDGEKMKIVPLTFKSPMTPHSSRVSVVQQYMTFLPAEHIGRFFTGQSTRTVYYYHHPDAEDLKTQGLHQAMTLRNRANQGIDDLIQFTGRGQKTVRADDINSSLAKGLRENLSETLDAFGCVSLSLADTVVSGVEVLRTNGVVDVALNKTEICPYGNRCPSDVIRLLGGSYRCGLCPYAVRAVDHLPAVSAKAKQMLEKLVDKQNRLDDELIASPKRFSDTELDELERECSDLAAEATGWQLSEEVLYHTAERLREGKDHRRWVVQKPEIVEKDLRRIALPDNATAYTLARLQECIAFPTLESPQIRARFDLMRRQLLAKGGRVKEALSSAVPTNPAEECAGLLRSIVESHQLGYDEVVKVLESDSYLTALPDRMTPLLTGGD